MKRKRLTLLLTLLLSVMVMMSMMPTGVFAVEPAEGGTDGTVQETVLPGEQPSPEGDEATGPMPEDGGTVTETPEVGDDTEAEAPTAEEEEPGDVTDGDDEADDNAEPEETSEEAVPGEVTEEEAAPEKTESEEPGTEEKDTDVKAAADPLSEVPFSIPRVVIHINGGQAEVDKMNASEDHSYHCKGTMDVLVPEGFKYVDSTKKLETLTGLPMDIRGRGNTSWGTKKNPYKIKLDDKTKILGMGKNKHWALIANYYDPSLMRNRLTYWLGKEVGLQYTPSGYPVDVFIEGKYYGSYLLTETMRVDKNRVEIDELDETVTEGIDLTGGYFVQFMQDYDTPACFTTDKGVGLQNVDPSFDVNDDGYENDAQKNYIRGYIQEAEYSLYEGEVRDKNAPGGYRSLDYHDYFDMESTALYWLVQEFTMNGDAYGTGSSYFYKPRDKVGSPSKIYWGPLWDFDYAYDYMGGPVPEETDFYTETEWMTALLTDQSEGCLKDEILQKWPEMRAALLYAISDGGLIDQWYEEVKVSQAQDQKKYKWKDEDGKPLVYEASVKTLKDWIRLRIDWFDEHLSDLDHYSHKVTFKTDKNDKHPVVYCYRHGYFAYNEDPEPEKKGYLFIGWYNQDGKKREDVQVTKDMTFTARYIKNEDATKATAIFFQQDDAYASLITDEFYPQYTVYPTDAQDKRIKWKSSDESIASVDKEGVVTMHKLGTVTITATLSSGVSKSFRLHVIEEEEDGESVSIDRDVMYLKVGDLKQIHALIEPPSGFYWADFSVNDPDIAEVDEIGVVHGLKAGTTTMDVTIEFASEEGWFYKEFTCTIVVSENEGALNTKTRNKGVKGEALNLETVAKTLLTERDREDMEGGADIDVCLDMTSLDEAAVPAEDKAALDTYLKKEGLTAGEYIDIDLTKKVGIGDEEAIHGTETPVEFSLTVPKSLTKTSGNVTRTFCLLRVHDGKVTKVASGKGSEITGKSSRFSTYLLAYSDKGGDDPPPTGDSALPFAAGAAVILSAGVLLALARSRREQR